MGRPDEGLRRESSSLNFVYEEPALVLRDSLVIADLHIGVESSYRKHGVYIPTVTEKLISKIRDLLIQTKTKRLIILGDVKHSIGVGWHEEREVPKFFEGFSDTQIDIVPGNHDGNLADILPDNVIMHTSRGFLKDGVYLTHGNAWPGEELSGSKRLIIGHLHPAIEFVDKLGSRSLEPCWMRCPVNKDTLRERYPDSPLKEVIVMPSFNHLAGSLAVNSFNPGGAILGAINFQKSDIYLLDGLHLGKIRDLEADTKRLNIFNSETDKVSKGE